MAKEGYQDRVIQYSPKWVNGKPEHNHIDGECVADFSCCYPDLFTDSLEQRQKSHADLVKKVRGDEAIS